RIQKNSVARPAQSAAAGICGHVVPAADGVAGGPPVGAVVKNSGGALRPVQESRLDALVDGWITHQPFRSVAVTRVAARVAPEVTSTSEWQRGPLFHGSKQ